MWSQKGEKGKSVEVNTDWSGLQMEEKYKKRTCVYVGASTHAETKHFNPN